MRNGYFILTDILLIDISTNFTYHIKILRTLNLKHSTKYRIVKGFLLVVLDKMC